MTAEDPGVLELAVEVPGTPEEVWRAVATGPGISSWYVPHTVEEHEGGAASASFGPGPEMQVDGRVAVWDPPRRVVFDSGPDGPEPTFAWHVEDGGDGTCVVRLVSTGFGAGEPLEGQREAMREGWGLFLTNLALHLEHFAGRTATAMLPMATWQGPRTATWAALTGGLGIPEAPAVGDRVATEADDVPSLAGTVVDVAPWRLALLVDDPAPGTAFLAVEGGEDAELLTVSVWTYLYGEHGAAAVARDQPRWQAWLADRAMAGG